MNYVDILNLWPDRKTLAADAGISAFAVDKWFIRKSIPQQYWPRLVDAARLRRLRGVTADTFLNAERLRLSQAA